MLDEKLASTSSKTKRHTFTAVQYQEKDALDARLVSR